MAAKSRVAGVTPLANTPLCYQILSIAVSIFLRWCFCVESVSLVSTMRNTPSHIHIAPFLLEVCTLLASGLVRLRRNTAQDVARDADDAREHREGLLRSLAQKSGHATSRERKRA
jgi:hypothetical protein